MKIKLLVIPLVLAMVLLTGCTNYDKKCLDELANKICIEEGYDHGYSYNLNRKIAGCFEYRSIYSIDLRIYDEELETCLED